MVENIITFVISVCRRFGSPSLSTSGLLNVIFMGFPSGALVSEGQFGLFTNVSRVTAFQETKTAVTTSPAVVILSSQRSAELRNQNPPAEMLDPVNINYLWSKLLLLIPTVWYKIIFRTIPHL